MKIYGDREANLLLFMVSDTSGKIAMMKKKKKEIVT